MQYKTKYEAPWDDIAVQGAKTGAWRYRRPQSLLEKCRQCGMCYLLCPQGCIVRHGRFFRADLDYCKGCGICARLCPTNALRMVRDEEDRP